MKILKTFLIMAGIALLSSCEKYLSEPNRLQASITKASQLQAMIDAPGNILTWANFASTFYSDDAYISATAWSKMPSSVNIIGLYYYTFDPSTMATNTNDYTWNFNWTVVLNANLILANVEQVSGTQEEKNEIKANALFKRAYAYWTLVNQYCQPYAPENLQSAGLPIRKSTSYTESLVRVSLDETYKFILADITQAQELIGNSDVQVETRWRISKIGIDAFLSRYYLFIGDYYKSVEHANKALASSKASLVDFNTIGPAPTSSSYTYDGTTYKVTYSELNQYTQAQYQQWPEFYFMSFTNSPFAGWYAKPSLVALFDQTNDLRYKHFLPPNSGFVSGWNQPGLYTYRMFPGSVLPTGPTVAEVLLNKAEASVRLKDLQTAMSLINTLRDKRFVTGSAHTVSASDPSDALLKVLEERRRELPFVFRYWDIRRYAYNETVEDDVTVSRSFYTVNQSNVDQSSTKTFTLPVKSPLYAIPIPQIDINASNGQLTQNLY